MRKCEVLPWRRGGRFGFRLLPLDNGVAFQLRLKKWEETRDTHCLPQILLASKRHLDSAPSLPAASEKESGGGPTPLDPSASTGRHEGGPSLDLSNAQHYLFCIKRQSGGQATGGEREGGVPGKLHAFLGKEGLQSHFHAVEAELLWEWKPCRPVCQECLAVLSVLPSVLPGLGERGASAAIECSPAGPVRGSCPARPWVSARCLVLISPCQ